MSSVFSVRQFLEAATTLVREHNVSRALVLQSFGQAYEHLARKKYGSFWMFHTHLEERGDVFEIFRIRIVVQDKEEPFWHISDEEARNLCQKDPHTYAVYDPTKDRDSLQKLGWFTKKEWNDPNTDVESETYKKIQAFKEAQGLFFEKLPQLPLGRQDVHTIRKLLMRDVRRSKREADYHFFKDRVGELVSGVVHRVKDQYIVVDVGRTECFVPRNYLLPHERYRVGERIKASIFKVAEENEEERDQVVLSRTSSDFLLCLLREDIPEIAEGLVGVSHIVREAGTRAKVAVYATMPGVDPVRICLGIKGARLRNITQELNGERIDIVLKDDEPAIYVANAMVPASVYKVVVGGDEKTFDVIVEDDQKGLALGRAGQNIRLASRLTGYTINVKDVHTQRTQEENMIASLESVLAVGPLTSRSLLQEGFLTPYDIAQSSLEDFSFLTIDDKDKNAMIQKAKDYAFAQEESVRARIKGQHYKEDLWEFVADIDPHIMPYLLRENVVSLKDFSDLSVHELWDMLQPMREDKSLFVHTKDDMGDWIMQARAAEQE